MGDPITARIANLEAVVFAGIASPASAQVISVPGASPIVVQSGGLVLITAPGPVSLNLAPPTAAQNNFAMWVLNANNLFNTITGSFSSTGTPSESFSSLADSGAAGNVCKLVAVGGVWQLASGIGWTGVGSGDS